MIANELGVPIRTTSGPVIEKPGDLAGILSNLQPREVLFIDEIHRLSPAIEEILYPAMEDFELDIVIGQGPGRAIGEGAGRAVHAGRRDDARGAADLAAARALRHRAAAGFLHGRRHRGDRAALGAHSRRPDGRRRGEGDRQPLARHAAHRQPAAAARARLRAGARRRHGHAARWRAPRWSCSTSTQYGFDESDRRLLLTIIDKFGGGPVGLGSLAAALSEEADAIEDMYEPYLIQIGFLERTPRGRMATARAYEYFGRTVPGRGLF